MFSTGGFFYRAVYEITWKNIVEPGRPHYNMAHAHYVLDSKVYKHTLRICNTYCFSTATVLAQTRLSVTLFVHCLSWYNGDGLCLLGGTN